MFSGIVQEIGDIFRIAHSRHGVELAIRAPKVVHRLKRGSSIAIDGCCTTVEKVRDSRFEIRLMPVTLKLTTLGALRVGSRVNLEPSLRVGDELGGHFVMGHVDGVGVITNRVARAVSLRAPTLRSGRSNPDQFTTALLIITAPASLRRFIVPRSSISVDGISLTVVSRRANVFTVSLVDYTLKHTTIGTKRVGDTVNIEIDALARYGIAKSSIHSKNLLYIIPPRRNNVNKYKKKDTL